jgi:hypothetical protein
MPPILIESIEVAGRIKGCTFSLMLFSATPSPLAWQLLYTAAKQSDTKSAAPEEQAYYSVDFRGPPTRRTVTLQPILVKSIEVADCIKG